MLTCISSNHVIIIINSRRASRRIRPTMYNLQNNVYKSPPLQRKDAQDIFLITWTMASRGRQNVGSYYLFSLSLYKKNQSLYTHQEYANMLLPFGPRLQYCTVPLLFGNLFTGMKWMDFKTELNLNSIQSSVVLTNSKQ